MEDSSSSEEDYAIPVLGGLSSDRSDSSSEETYYESDKEWRDAVKAAVESEIQIQVQLRLSLESPKRQKKCKQETDSGNERETKLQNRYREEGHPGIYGVGDREDLTVEIEPAGDGQQYNKKTAAKINTEEDHQLPTIPTQTASTITPREKKKTETIQDYIHNKYGTPRGQLHNLKSDGTFDCVSWQREGGQIPGIDDRLRWPMECNITQPTPELSGRHLKKNVPFFPEAPVLGSARPSFVRTAQDCTVVFDRSLADNQPPLGNGVLSFESRFESGNLQQAIKVGSHEYDLVLSNDLYTDRHTQWFFFRVSGMDEGAAYTFNIINFRKRSSLYSYGMKLLMYSESEGAWSRAGQNICYKKLPIVCQHTTMLKKGLEYYYLSWKMIFSREDDKCYFAHCYPYTYSHLLRTLDNYEKDHARREYLRREELCRTLAGNVCPILTITDFQVPEQEWAERTGVVFSARVHPGETNSSWMMGGVLDFLTSDHKHARYLRSKFVFKIIPMLNPDGVVVGNYRTSLSGVDLNRVYKTPIEKLFPTVAATKKLIKEFNEERKVSLYVDLHGHSRAYNVFMYGCHTHQCNHQQFLEERAVPWMLSQMCKETFSFKKCKFAVQRCKEATGRVSIWKEGIPNSFTLEASFCGTNLTRPTPLHFTSEDLEDMGKELCQVLLKVHRYNKSNSYRFKVNSFIAEYYMDTINNQEEINPPASTLEPQGLPDIVTSTKQGDGDTDQQSRRKSRKHMAKILQRFHSLSMKKLEVESSTSGSDSENDEFEYCQRKSRSKNKQKKSKHHRLSQKPQGNSNQNNNKMPKLEHLIVEHSKNAPEHDPTKTGERNKAGHVQHAAVSSAPPRLQGASIHSQHGWRFVNRYSNRSNGGIPIFSQERSKERAERKEKERLKSLSQIQSTEVTKFPSLTSPYMSVHSSDARTSARPLMSGRDRDHTPSLNLPSLIWKPFDSQREIPPLSNNSHTNSNGWGNTERKLKSSSLGLFPPPKLSRHNSDGVLGGNNPVVHYKNVKRLVEGGRPFPPVNNQPRPQMGVASRMPHPPLPAGMPPKLCRYISEIWQRHL